MTNSQKLDKILENQEKILNKLGNIEKDINEIKTKTSLTYYASSGRLSYDDLEF